MHRKYGKLRKQENIIVFPGTFERLVEKGYTAVDLEAFDDAVEAFDQAIKYEPDFTEFLGPYAVALYETKDFQRAKEISSRLLQSGTADYINAIELYLTISIQLQEYDEVEMTIETLIEEGIIPPELIAKFTYLRELNSRMSMRYDMESSPISKELFTIDMFMNMDSMTQQHTLASIEGTDISSMIPVLEDIAESISLSPLVISFALTLLYQANSLTELTIRKFNFERVITPAHMTLPGQDDKTVDVMSALERELAQDPSRYELAEGLVQKFVITAFPFDWGDYSAEEIAESYVSYIDSMFSGESIPNTPLCAFIEEIDRISDLD